MANVVYNQAKVKLGDGTINWTSAAIRMALVKSGFTVNPDDDNLGATNLATYESSGGNYVRKALGTRTVSADDSNDRALYDCTADIVWTALGAAAGPVVGALIYLQVGGDDTTPNDDVPLVYLDFAVTPNGGDVTLQFSSSPSAVFTIT